ncbi:nucleoside-diphosphate sugar epimerase [Flavobacteriaceae bacterium 3-367]
MKALKTAIVLGATGLTGGLLVELLIADQRYGTIKLFSRSSIGYTHPKVKEYLVSMLELQHYQTDFVSDEVFCCIGTTKTKTPDRDRYEQIDYGIPVQAAQLCKQNGIGTFVVVSALGANAKSAVFYNRIKGRMEEAVLGLGLAKTYILQPSLIGGKRNEKRIGEWLAKQVMKALNPIFVGSLKKYRSIHPATIAKAMLWLANHRFESPKVSSDKIKAIAEKTL